MMNRERLIIWIDRSSLATLLFLLIIIPIHSMNVEWAMGGVLVLVSLRIVEAALVKRLILPWSPLHWIVLAFLAFCLVQLLPLPFSAPPWSFGHSFDGLPADLTRWSYLTVDRQATVEAVRRLAILVGIFVLVPIIISTPGRLRLLVNWLIGVGFSIAILMILNRFSPPNQPLLGGAWPLGFYFRQLEYPGLLEMLFPLPVAMVFARGARRDQVILYGFAGVVIGVVVATAVTQGSLMVLIAELVAFGLLSFSGRRPSRSLSPRRARASRLLNTIGVTVFIAGLLAGVVWTATRPISQEISKDVEEELRGLLAIEGQPIQRAEYARLVMWKNGLRMFAEHPLAGVGWGAFATGYARYDTAPGFRRLRAAHNDYVQLLAETGLIGGTLLALFLIALVRLSRRGWASPSPFGRSVALGASLGCFGILVHGLVDFYLQSMANAFIFAVLVAVLVVVRRLDIRYGTGGARQGTVRR